MLPRMSAQERDLFLAFLRHSRRYVEFGTGGSTVLAAEHVGEAVLAVDSDPIWVDKVAAACIGRGVTPRLILVDIGPTVEWGFPADDSRRALWPDYHTAIWSEPQAAAADLYLVDGRFRVACFAQTVLHARPDALICVHDFASRPNYHAVRAIAQEVASAEDMSVFRPRPGGRARARALLDEYRLVAD